MGRYQAGAALVTVAAVPTTTPSSVAPTASHCQSGSFWCWAWVASLPAMAHLLLSPYRHPHSHKYWFTISQIMGLHSHKWGLHSHKYWFTISQILVYNIANNGVTLAQMVVYNIANNWVTLAQMVVYKIANNRVTPSQMGVTLSQMVV